MAERRGAQTDAPLRAAASGQVVKVRGATSKPLRIVLSGAAGLLGSELAVELAAAGHAVLGLVHRRSSIRRNDGSPVATGAWHYGSIATGPGDVCDPLLGLSSARHAQLAAAADMVVHCAALTEFGWPADAYDLVNVRGTGHMLALAQAAPRPLPFVHVSTAFVCGERSGLILERELDVGQAFGNAYEQSKCRAEQLVHAAHAAGLPALIARPSVIVGESEHGQLRELKNLYVVLKVVSEGKVRAIPGNYDATVDLVPLDYVRDALVALIERFDAAVGQTLHLTAGVAATLRDFSDVLAEHPALEVPRFVPPLGFDLAALPVNERRYYERIVAPYAGYFRRTITFDTRESRRLLGSELSAPLAGKALLRRALEHCERVGFLGRPALSEVLLARERGQPDPSEAAT